MSQLTTKFVSCSARPEAIDTTRADRPTEPRDLGIAEGKPDVGTCLVFESALPTHSYDGLPRPNSAPAQWCRRPRVATPVAGMVGGENEFHRTNAKFPWTETSWRRLR